MPINTKCARCNEPMILSPSKIRKNNYCSRSCSLMEHDPEWRFLVKTKRDHKTGCLLWMGKRDRNGYGFFCINMRQVRAHRWAYERWVGPIPHGMAVLHSCDNPPCVDVGHLRVGTDADNVLDRESRDRNGWSRRTHCKHGHEFTPDNTTIRVTKQGWRSRVCRTCKALSSKASRYNPDADTTKKAGM